MRTRTTLCLAALAALLQASCIAQTNPQVQDASTATQAQAVAVATPAAAPAAVAAVTTGEVRLGAGLESAYVLQGSDGQTYMVVDLQTAAAATQVTRPSMAVALVIDRSGSMAGDKIVNAQAAASSFIASMADGDIVAVYQYDDVVEMIAPPTLVNAASRSALTAAISMVTPRGSTNLHGGLVTGIAALASPQAERPVRRVILISDGLANVGPSSPEELGAAAAGAAASGISVTTIGVGLDYDERTMSSVAIRSGGRFYHMQEPAQLAAILETELNALGATVARGVYLELVPTQGVEILGATGADLTREGNLVRLSVGDMLGQQSRQVVIPVRVPTSGAAAQTAAQLTLRYRPADSDEVREHQATVGYTLASSEGEVANGLRPELAVAVERYRSVQAREQAAALVAQGEADRAADVLERQAAATRTRATAVPAAAAAEMRRDAESLAGRGGRVRAARSAPAARVQALELNDEAMDAQGF
jgi:Ca-activated chloride channel family protein